MPDALTQTSEDALAMFRHHQALALQNFRKADAYLNQFLGATTTKEKRPSASRLPQCVAIWTEWLAENGPNTRQHITDATGVKFTERGTPHTVHWDDLEVKDVEFPPSTIVRFTGRKHAGAGRGAAPVIYALWSQRFDVRPIFGVGPVSEPKAMTGVIQPPVSSHPIDPEFGDEQPLPLSEPEPFDHVAWAAKMLAERDGEAADG